MRDSWGNQVEWYDEQLGRTERYDIAFEMRVNEQTYALLQPASFADPHPYLFKYSFSQNGTPALAPIEAEDEWERAADAFADWLKDNSFQ